MFFDIGLQKYVISYLSSKFYHTKIYINRFCCDEIFKMYTNTQHIVWTWYFKYTYIHRESYLMWTEKQEAQKLKSERALQSVLTTKKHKDFLSQSLMCVQFISISTYHPNAFKFCMQYSRRTYKNKSEFGPIFALGIYYACI